MPNVPNVPGVPALSSFSTSDIALLTADVVAGIGAAVAPQWGIYLNGTPIIASAQGSLFSFGTLASSLSTISSFASFAEFVINLGLGSGTFSVVDFAFRQDMTIADYPVEDGGFQSYDKVQSPFDVRMRVAAGGDEANRQALLQAVSDATNTLFLYDVYTPEQVYQSCSIVHFDYARKAGNVGLLVVDIWLQEVRVTSTATFQSTQQPTDAGQASIGNVSPLTPSQRIEQAFSSFT